MPTLPGLLTRAFQGLKKLWTKVFDFFGSNRSDSKEIDVSLLRLSLQTPFGVGATAICSSTCAKGHKMQLEAGFSEAVGDLSVGFGKDVVSIVLLRSPLGWHLEPGVCFEPMCESSEPSCAGCATTAPSTTQATTAALTTQPTTVPVTTAPPCKCASDEEPITSPTGRCICLPKCKSGRKRVLVNKRYQCPEYPLCGRSPTCVLGRKGRICSQPDMLNCPFGCSGNGVVFTLADCGAQCRCFRRWTGTCCNRRRPWRNWGDPHLETLDGIEFDYFGIGEFWGCKSLFNDFGVQFRYFAYQRASLTGGVAIKVGQSVLTIMSVKTMNPREYPKLRIDGALVNISADIGKKIILDNGTVVMEMQKAFSNESEEAAIMLLSLQYESGLTLTTDVRYSHVMGRQFLNVLFTPTAAFKGFTEGLCGIMDNDESNDLRGPNGEQYKDPINFADSWRITTTQSNSSLRGTWSWNASNFHEDDVMDSTYTDSNHVPVYSLKDIDDAIVAKATSACSALGLSKAMLNSCIFDVSVTNDTSLTAQETLQEDCPGQCSGKGRCVNSTCQCMVGWSGDSCQKGDCSNCSSEHGTCVKGFCECDDGWEGATCEQKATCYNVNNCTNPKNGICTRTDRCRCHDGYIGTNCSVVPTCHNVSSCSGRGICIDFDICKCQREWTGKDCTQFSCESLDYCSGHGRCIALYACECFPGWTGDSCALPDCAGANHCSGRGECVASNTCQCYPGFQGVSCSDVADCSILGNCSGNGVCMQDINEGNLTCRCFAGFSGLNCSVPQCLSVNNCSGHGACIEADFCKCDDGYTGLDCAIASCNTVNYCSGHGICIGFDTCVCDPLWHGAACSLANCSGVNDCSKKGTCILPNTCECYPGYDGVACNTTAGPNLHAPVFSAPFYNFTLPENTPIKTKIFQVNASDADTGRNARLFFLLDDSNAAVSAFTIDSLSGVILTSATFHYESSSPKVHTLKIVVFDDGVPRKSDFALAFITVADENDNCPVFNSTQSRNFTISRDTSVGTLLTVVSADDKDSGLNGEVRYSLSSRSILDGPFMIDEKSGEVTIASGLTEESYRLLVNARDLGLSSCSRQIELTVDVFSESETTERPSAITTADTTTSEAGTSMTSPKSDVPVSFQPEASSWYKKTPFIIGTSLGFIFLVILLVLVFLAVKRRSTRRPKPARDKLKSWKNQAYEMDTAI